MRAWGSVHNWFYRKVDRFVISALVFPVSPECSITREPARTGHWIGRMPMSHRRRLTGARAARFAQKLRNSQRGLQGNLNVKWRARRWTKLLCKARATNPCPSPVFGTAGGPGRHSQTGQMRAMASGHAGDGPRPRGAKDRRYGKRTMSGRALSDAWWSRGTSSTPRCSRTPRPSQWW